MEVGNKRWISYLLIVSGLVVSCEEEREDSNKNLVDKELPVLRIVSPEETSKVWLTTSLEVEASDNREVAKVEFYLDEEILGEDTETPYLLELDTRQYEDGAHMLKVKAFDKAGNQQVATQVIEILNKLIQVNVGENHLDNDWAPEEGWIVVTDVDGSTIDYKPLVNNESVTIDRPKGVEARKVNIIVIKNTFFGEGNKSLIINQYNNISPLVWNMPSRSTPQEIGTATVSYVVPAEYEKYLESTWNGKSMGGYSWYYRDRENDLIKTSSLKIQQEPAGMFVMIHNVSENELPRFALLDNIQLNDYYSLGRESFQKMELWQTITIPKTDHRRISVDGDSENGHRYNIYSDIGTSTIGNISAYNHQSTFTNFSFDLSFSTRNMSYSVFSKEKPQSQYRFPNQKIEIIEKASDRFLATVSSEDTVTYGMVQLGSWYDVDGFQHMIVWNIHTDLDDTLDVKKALLPEEIKNNYAELEEHQPEYVFTELKTYKNISSLQVYLEKFDGPNDKDAEYERTSFYYSSTNGRLAREKHLKIK